MCLCVYNVECIDTLSEYSRKVPWHKSISSILHDDDTNGMPKASTDDCILLRLWF